MCGLRGCGSGLRGCGSGFRGGGRWAGVTPAPPVLAIGVGVVIGWALPTSKLGWDATPVPGDDTQGATGRVGALAPFTPGCHISILGLWSLGMS